MAQRAVAQRAVAQRRTASWSAAARGTVQHDGVEPEPLLAGERTAGMLVWWPLLSVLYLLLVPAWEPVGVVLLGCALVVAGMLRAVWRLGPRERR